MSAKPGVAAAGAETNPDAPHRTPSKARPPARPDASAEPASADLRLVIDEDGEPSGHLYTVVDRRTGKIIHQFRRGEMQRRVELGRYIAGDGVSVKA